MARVWNFSAGPSTLPEQVLQTAAAEMMDYQGSGQSVMEMSHRSKTFDKIIKDAEALMRELYQVPDNYKVLFLQGGASAQFSAIPLNFMNGSGKADYIITGQWAKKAYQEAQKYGDVQAVASSADKNFSYIPKTAAADFRDNADYVYICMNNTIYGTVYKELPPVGDKVLIADVSSCALSQPLDISKFGMVYFGAQKNVAPAGLVVAIIREDLLGNARPTTPVMMNYQVQADADSLYNTPPCWCIYMLGLTLDWLDEQGGIEGMEQIKHGKAQMLYDCIDSSKLFTCAAEKPFRSDMNVTFRSASEELDAKFVKEAAEAGFVNLKGHRKVGGMRASIYNAVPVEGVEKLCDFIRAFDKAN